MPFVPREPVLRSSRGARIELALFGDERGSSLLRKVPKDQRKEKILDSVEELIMSTGSTDFTMHQLAKHVGISPTTFYNLFGSKGSVLYGLLNRGLTGIISGRNKLATSDDPIENAIMTMTYAAEFFVRKPGLYRSLYKFQLGERDMAARPSYLNRGLVLWQRSLDGLVEAGYLSDDPKDGTFLRDDVALSLLTHSSGVIDLWVQEDIDDAEFVARMTHDAALIVHAVVPEPERKRIAKKIRELRPHLRRFSFFHDA